MAGVAGIEGEGDEDRIGGEVTSGSVGCGPSILNLESGNGLGFECFRRGILKLLSH